jgi:hypothetical protein
MWSSSGSPATPYASVAGGYNFALPWRQTLPGVISVGLGLYNFVTGNNALLGYKADFFGTTTSSANVNLLLTGSNARLVYLAFSVVVVT